MNNNNNCVVRETGRENHGKGGLTRKRKLDAYFTSQGMLNNSGMDERVIDENELCKFNGPFSMVDNFFKSNFTCNF